MAPLAELRLRVSTHDPEDMGAYSGSPEAWESSVGQLKAITESKLGDDYEIGVGEAAFYGPKLDFMAKDALGREHQVATIQLDFNQPEGFDLTCVNESGEAERIVMIHCAVMGSIERFLVVLIEHTAGRFPVWLAPEQVRVATVNATDEMISFGRQVIAQFKAAGLRATLDEANESVGKKIRAAELGKVPYTIVLGEKELASGEVVPRIRKDLSISEPQPMQIKDFVQSVANESHSRTTKSSL